jgi:heterodisulfide reductase subunit C
MEQTALIPGLKNPVKEYLSKFDLNLCLTCGTCTNGCPVTGGEGAEGLDTRKALRMLALGMVDEVVQSKFPWLPVYTVSLRLNDLERRGLAELKDYEGTTPLFIRLAP